MYRVILYIYIYIYIYLKHKTFYQHHVSLGMLLNVFSTPMAVLIHVHNRHWSGGSTSIMLICVCEADFRIPAHCFAPGAHYAIQSSMYTCISLLIPTCILNIIQHDTCIMETCICIFIPRVSHVQGYYSNRYTCITCALYACDSLISYQ